MPKAMGIEKQGEKQAASDRQGAYLTVLVSVAVAVIVGVVTVVIVVVLGG